MVGDTQEGEAKGAAVHRKEKRRGVGREEPAERWRGEGGPALEAGRRRGPVLGQVKGRGGPGPGCPSIFLSQLKVIYGVTYW